MAEVRTTSSTGGQKGVKPERHGLIPRKATAWISRVFGFGASKYEDHNWRRGYEWDKSIDALQRHIDAFVDGDTYDDESGLPHLAHAGFHIMVLLTWLEEQGEGVDNVFDTRWPHAMERARRAKEQAEPEEQASLRGQESTIAWTDETISFEPGQVSLESLALIFGGEAVAREASDPYAWPLRFIAGGVEADGTPSKPVRMPCYVEPHFTLDAAGGVAQNIPTRPFDQSYEDWAANQVSVDGVNGVQRAFNPQDYLKD